MNYWYIKVSLSYPMHFNNAFEASAETGKRYCKFRDVLTICRDVSMPENSSKKKNFAIFNRL
jgi:hypothetical protein